MSVPLTFITLHDFASVKYRGFRVKVKVVRRLSCLESKKQTVSASINIYPSSSITMSAPHRDIGVAERLDLNINGA